MRKQDSGVGAGLSSASRVPRSALTTAHHQHRLPGRSRGIRRRRGLLCRQAVSLPLWFTSCLGIAIILGSSQRRRLTDPSAVKAFTQSLLKELVATGIRVSEVAPGFAETNFALTRFRGDEAAAKAVYKGFTPRECGEHTQAAMAPCASHIKSRPAADTSRRRGHRRGDCVVRPPPAARADCRAL